MGSQVIAKCKCGLETEILIGGGMFNFKTTCLFPCMCESCHGVVEANLLENPVRCPNCNAVNPISYDDPSLSLVSGKNVVASWNMREQLGRELILTDGKYKCPSCGKMTLSFVNSGLCFD